MENIAEFIYEKANSLCNYLHSTQNLSSSKEQYQISTKEAEQLANYLDLLKKWTDKIDLVSVADDKTLIQRHLLDSVAASIMLNIYRESLELDLSNILDLGSGAGLPGIVLAILNPESNIVLCEPREKRGIFLKEAQRRLSLTNTKVIVERFEDLPAEINSKISLVISRAVNFEKNLWFEIINSDLSPNAKICLMQSVQQDAEQVPDRVNESAVIKYNIFTDGPPRALKFFSFS